MRNTPWGAYSSRPEYPLEGIFFQARIPPRGHILPGQNTPLEGIFFQARTPPRRGHTLRGLRVGLLSSGMGYPIAPQPAGLLRNSGNFSKKHGISAGNRRKEEFPRKSRGAPSPRSSGNFSKKHGISPGNRKNSLGNGNENQGKTAKLPRKQEEFLRKQLGESPHRKQREFPQKRWISTGNSEVFLERA